VPTVHAQAHHEEWWIYKDELRHKLMLHGVYCQSA